MSCGEMPIHGMCCSDKECGYLKHGFCNPTKAIANICRRKRQVVLTTMQTLTGEPITEQSGQQVTDYTRQPIIEPSGQSVTEHTRQPFKQHSGQPITYHTRQPIIEHSRQPITEHNGLPVTEHSGQPVTEHTRWPTTEHSGQTELTRQPITEHSGHPITEFNRESITEHFGQPVTEHTRQSITDHSRQPITENNDQPVTEHIRQPFTEHSGQPVTEHTRQPITKRFGQPETGHSGQPITEDSGQPETDHTRQPITVYPMEFVTEYTRGSVSEHTGEPVTAQFMETVHGGWEPYDDPEPGMCDCRPGYIMMENLCLDETELLNQNCYELTCTGFDIGCTAEWVARAAPDVNAGSYSCALGSEKEFCFTEVEWHKESVTEKTGCAVHCKEEASSNRTVSCCHGNLCNANNTTPFKDKQLNEEPFSCSVSIYLHLHFFTATLLFLHVAKF